MLSLDPAHNPNRDSLLVIVITHNSPSFTPFIALLNHGSDTTNTKQGRRVVESLAQPNHASSTTNTKHHERE
jgi:hypothetical protein